MIGAVGVPELLVVLSPILLVLYFLPTIVAVLRQTANVGTILVVNVLLGWSIVGWIVAIVWAALTTPVDAAPAMRHS